VNKLKRMQPLLGTFVEVGIITEMDSGDDAITAAFKGIKKVQDLLSFHNADSDLSRLNKSGQRGIELHPISADVLRLALHMTGVTEGDFNCTIGGALIEKGVLPDHGGLRPIRIGTVDDVILNGCHVRLLRPIRITLDGIAKGYAVDHAVNILKQQGIHSGWINAGGDLRVFGDITIPVYRREMNESHTFLGKFSNTALSTSSAQFDYDSRFPSLILNSHTHAYKAGIWTVKAGSSWLADALTKVAGVSSDNTVNKKIASFGCELLVGL
jgi:thiamine biosynthesis lipoprotein